MRLSYALCAPSSAPPASFLFAPRAEVHITRFAEALCEATLGCDRDRERVMAEYNITMSNSSYTLKPGAQTREEILRLSEMHEAFKQYLDGKLCLPPLDDAHPCRVLQLGATQAAIQFPDAEIVAVDLAEPPNRRVSSFPANLKFHMADLPADLNFESGSFDMVHARFVLIHVVNGKDVIVRAARLVKPGGLLLLEDTDAQSMIETGGPAVHFWQSKLLEFGRSRGTDREIGRKIAGIMASLPCMQDVHVRKVSAPFSGAGAVHLYFVDEATNQLGRALGTSMARGSIQTVSGFSVEMAKETAAEINASDCMAKMDIYFCWASSSTAPQSC
ncbi:hypothetical protein C8J57DRAFT_1512439 [Mycena rebaudengoi]|nr:hypothetical protein C8J57DRAFT_1512439 [Mycena rebaudengoi]